MYHPAVNDLWSQFYAPLRRRQHRSAYDGCSEWGHYKSNNKFLLRCSEVIFLGLLTMYVPILYLPTFSESNAWDFHLVVTEISGNVRSLRNSWGRLMARLLIVNVMDLLLASPVVIQRICRIHLCTSFAIYRKEAEVKFRNSGALAREARPRSTMGK